MLFEICHIYTNYLLREQNVTPFFDSFMCKVIIYFVFYIKKRMPSGDGNC